MSIRAGVLSDTHITTVDPVFQKLAARCFADCEIIIHAGDLVDPGILSVFAGKSVYAVHGNTCHASARFALPERRLFKLGRFTIGLAHGAYLQDIEDSLWTAFPEADCIIYGHTHRAVCHREGAKAGQGGVLFLNPGAFKNGSYAILEADDELQATLLNI